MNNPLHDTVIQQRREEVFEAIKHNDVAKLQELLNNEDALKFPTDLTYLPLRKAILEQKRECFDVLVNHKNADLNPKSMVPPLHLALSKSDPYYALTLIKKGVDVNSVHINYHCDVFYRFRSFITPLDLTNDLVNDELILNDKVNHVCEDVKRTPIFTIIMRENLNWDIFDGLLFYGADVTIPDERGDLPFFRCLHPEIEEMLFELTFDSLERYEVRFKDFLQLIARESPFFYHILELCSSVKYSPHGWNWELFNNDRKLMMIRSLLDKFKGLTFEVVLTKNPLCGDFTVLRNPWRGHYTNLPNVMFALDGSYASKLMIENLYEIPQYNLDRLNYDLNRPLYNLEDFFWRYKSTEFILYLLSHGFPVNPMLMDIIYYQQGFNELFEMLLHMEIIPPKHCSNSRHIYDLNYKAPKNDKLVKFFHQYEGAPSLMELSREVARQHLVSSYGIKNCGMYLSVLKCLPIPQSIQDVLCYKQALY